MGLRALCRATAPPPSGSVVTRVRPISVRRCRRTMSGRLRGAVSLRIASQERRSLKGFPNAPELAALLSEVGLTQVRALRLGGGTVALHRARNRCFVPSPTLTAFLQNPR